MAATITVPGMFLTGDHASLPAANAVGVGTLYACSTHSKLYQSDGAVWTDWFAPSAGIGAWTDYTPALTASTTNPTLGSSTITGRYKMIDDTLMAIRIGLAITTGGAWNPGNGRWRFSLPAGVTTPISTPIAAHILDAGVGFYSATAIVEASSDLIEPIIVADQAGNRELGHNAPVVWATGDFIRIAGIFEID